MNTSPLSLILASASPQRRKLLAEAGYRFQVIEPHPEAEKGANASICAAIDSLPLHKSEDNHDNAGIPEAILHQISQWALRKAGDVAQRHKHGIFIGCDTVAWCRGEILGKPTDREDARRMLQLLQGERHAVISGLALWRRPDDKKLLQVASSWLQMETISDQALDAYLATEMWKEKAGAFGYQDQQDWIRLVAGSESNVIGLPLELLKEMLESMEA